ncbi:MAG: hypothetical protein ACPGLV_02495 [Bacteroidia bacterium]
MDNLTFKRRLIDFFERHDKNNLGLVDNISKQYAGNEQAVFETLNQFYTEKKSGVSREQIKQELSTHSPIMGQSVGRGSI